MTTRLFKRAWKVTLGAVEVSALDIEFKVKKTSKPEPNTCDLRVYNLNADSRAALQVLKKVHLRLDAGYDESLSQIYFGRVRTCQSTTEGPNVITDFSSADSEKQIRGARINASFPPKTAPGIALRALVKALGVGQGNVDSAVALLQSKGVASLYGSGVVLTGNVARQLTDFCRSAQVMWSVQDGKMEITDLGKPLEGKAFELSSDTGLIGSPTIDSKGVVSATTLMLPDLRPNVQVSFKAKHLTGVFKVIQCEYSGQTNGADWTIKLLAASPLPKKAS